VHGHGGIHGHGHGGREGNRRRLLLTLIVTGSYLVAELIGGILSGSLALLADAAHMLSDTAALALAFFAMWIAERPANAARTFGYRRAEILAALANGAALAVMAIFIVLEAVERLGTPPAVDAPLMVAVAAGGLVANLVGLAALHGGSGLNLRGAYLHVMGDALGSVGAIISGVLIWTLGWSWADPAASLLIAVLVAYSAWHLVGETLHVLMEAAPAHIDVDEVRAAMRALPGVLDVHDLHIWTITSGMESLSGHVVMAVDSSHHQLLVELRRMLHQRFDIDHVTLQIEPLGFDEHGNC
jgi:cobalt-zinc-cadmium efflux system protein